MVSSTADPKHVIIIAQDVATYKVMDFLDVRCTGLAQGQNARADLYFPPSYVRDGCESNDYPTGGWVAVPHSPAGSVC